MITHTGAFMQKGRGRRQAGLGLGGFFRSLFSAARPIFQKVLSVGKKVVSHPLVTDTVADLKDGLVDVAVASSKDILQGENVKDSILKNTDISKKDVTQKLINRIDGYSSNRKRRKDKKEFMQEKRPRKKKRRKKMSKDLFDTDSEGE